MQIKDRVELIKLMPKNCVCAEIGVLKGEFSTQILDIVQPTMFWLVDLFEGMNAGEYNQGASHNLVQNKYLDSSIVKIYKGRSNDFFKIIPDNYFDFVYIDADHSYRGVKDDLDNSLRTVKKGGFILGHDYDPIFEGVKYAVHEFCGDNEFDFTITLDESLPSFLIQVT